jgi:hypothetical protein
LPRLGLLQSMTVKPAASGGPLLVNHAALALKAGTGLGEGQSCPFPDQLKSRLSKG